MTYKILPSAINDLDFGKQFYNQMKPGLGEFF